MSDTLAELALRAYTFLLPITWYGIAIVVFVAGPLSLARGLRNSMGWVFLQASWLVGATTWFLGAAVVFSTWGLLGLIIGLMLFGVGVVPVGMAAAIIALHNWGLVGSLIVFSVIAFVFRFRAISLLSEHP